MAWITQEELKGHIAEHGEFSYACIVLQVLDDNGETDYFDLVHSHTSIKDERIGKVMIIQEPDDA
jgi:hypothetical protein